MTISESVIAFLKRFESEGLASLNRIETDRLQAVTASYGLLKAPNETVKRYISGTEIRTVYFEFRARLDAQTDQSRIDNQAWFEGLTDWIGSMNKKGDFPILEAGIECQNVAISNQYFMGQADENSAIYSLTIAIVCKKKG